MSGPVRLAKERFERFLLGSATELRTTSPDLAFNALAQFHEGDTVDGMEISSSGLLFEWGCHEWGNGLNFELSLTRQMGVHMAPDLPDEMLQAMSDEALDAHFGDDGLWQLKVVYRYDPATYPAHLAPGNAWAAPLGRMETSELLPFIRMHPSVQAVQSVEPHSVELRLDAVD